MVDFTRWLRGPSRVAALQLTSGTAAAQLINLALIPLLARLYSPAEIGVLSAFLALSAWIGSASTGRYDQACMLPADERKATILALLSVSLSFATASVTLVVVLVVVPILTSATKDYSWLYWLAPMVAVTGVNATLTIYATRSNEYRLVATRTTMKALFSAVFQVMGGLAIPSAGTLVGAQTLGLATANSRMMRQLRDGYRRDGPVSASDLRDAAREYQAFPRHTLPAVLVNTTAINSIPLFIGAMFGAVVLGLWSVAYRMLGIPLLLLGNAVGQVYFKRATDVHNSGGDSMALFRRTSALLAGISVLPFIGIWVLAPFAFTTLLGPQWEAAGQYAQIMVPWLWLRFVASPVQQTPIVFGRNGIGLISQLIVLSGTLIVFVVAWTAGWTFVTFLQVLSITMSLAFAATWFVNRQVIVTATSGQEF